tara:strand:- start:222 stop:431 length:210 start_codon:yes stop_codon:yes gene_type:complete
MIKLQLGGNNQQKITKVCNTCGTHIQDLEVEDIMVKGDTDLIIEDKDGNEITRTDIPNDLKISKCENCE